MYVGRMLVHGRPLFASSSSVYSFPLCRLSKSTSSPSTCGIFSLFRYTPAELMYTKCFSSGEPIFSASTSGSVSLASRPFMS